MLRLFYNTVSAISYDIARAQITTHSLDSIGPFNDITAFTLASWARMPRFLAWPLRLATIGFSVSSILSSGSLYHRLEPRRRAVLLASWRCSKIGPCRDLIRFYDSLALLSFYSRELDSPSHPSLHDLEHLSDALEHTEAYHG